MSHIRFGTSGWRGVISEDFTFFNVRRAAQAICNHLKTHPEFGIKALPQNPRTVLVGYDTRFLSEQFAAEAAGVFAANGFKVLFSRQDVPTPALAHAVGHRKSLGAVNITASHNPANYNGIKWTPYWGGPAIPPITQDIERFCDLITDHDIHFHPQGKAQKEDRWEESDFKPPYLKQLHQLLDWKTIKRAGPKLGVDCLYGTARHYLPEILRAWGCEVQPLHLQRDVLFGNGMPEPSPETLSELTGYVRRKYANLGLACDGDADRFGLLDEGGVWISPNEFLGLLLHHLVQNRGWKGKVVRSVMTSHFVDAVAKFHGLEVRETPVGFKYIGELLREGEYILGGEESGGLSLKGHVPEKDGILACLLAVEIVSTEKKSLSQIKNFLFKQVGPTHSQRINCRIPNPHLIREIQEKLKLRPPLDLAGSSVWRIDETDGFKFLLKDGSWLGLRLSGTEPVARLYLEAASPKMLDKLLEAGKKLLKGEF